MATTIKLKNGSGAPLAGDLVQGEPALDLTNKRLYTEDAGGNVIEIGTSPSTIDINAGTIDGVTLGTNSAVTEAQIDNININGNTITSTDTNGNIAITPNGTGEVDISKVDINGGTIDGTVIGGASAGAGTFTTLNTTGAVVFNEAGADVDFRVESDANANALFVDGGNSRVGINNSSPASALDVTGTVTANGLDIVDGSDPNVLIRNSAGQSTLKLTSSSNSGDPLSKIEFVNTNYTAGGEINAYIQGETNAGSGGRRDANIVFYTGGFADDNAANIVQRLRIADTGDISFYEDTGTTPKLFWDASAESLGIGYSGANLTGTKLALGDTSASNTVLQMYSSTTGNNTIRFGDAANSDPASFSGYIQYNHTSDYMRFATGTAERMRIDSAGNVGIGTTSPLDLSGVGFTTLEVKGSTDGLVGVSSGLSSAFGRMYNNGTVCYVGTSTSHALILDTNDTERMRIDTSGNLLVNTTDATPANNNDSDGISLRAGGQIQASTSLNNPLTLNRKSDDGNIALFKKDGTTVGSIGVANGDNLYIASDDTTDVGLKFDGDANAIYGCNASGGIRDDAITLGDSAVRFKDLYLSGGVYVGGTTSANLLDDYEEGTFTPSITDGTTSKAGSGSYTKVGDAVFVTITISNIGTGFSGTLEMSGLPFTAATTTTLTVFINDTATATSWQAVTTAGTAVRFYKVGATSASFTQIDASDTNTGTDFYVAGSYKTS